MTSKEQSPNIVPDLWVSGLGSNPQAKLRLFCLPYAGAGTAIYRPWSALLPSGIELCLVNLPGREKRLRETPYSQLSSIVEILAEVLPNYLDKPFAFFGHSMGALICFELSRQLRQRYARRPVHLFLSAHRAPQIPDTNPPLRYLSDNAFLQSLQQRYGSLPAVLLQDPELRLLFLPTLRADLTIIETYSYQEEPPLNCPISAFGGRQDKAATEESLSAWRTQTTGEFKLTMFPGDHFFIQSEQTSLLQTVTDGLKKSINGNI